MGSCSGLSFYPFTDSASLRPPRRIRSLACFQMKATKAVSVLLLASICWDDHGTAGVDAESTTTASSGTQSQKTTPSHYNGFPLKTRVVVDRNYTNPSWTGYGWATLAKHSCQHTAVVGGPTYSSSDAAEAACEKTDGCMAMYVSVRMNRPFFFPIQLNKV